MLQFRFRPSRRALFAILAVTLAGGGAAAAATIHTYNVSNTSGSQGSYEFLQTAQPGGALQAEVGSSAYTGLTFPFALFGFYRGSGGPGSGVIGISTTLYGVAGASQGANPAILAYGEGTGVGLEATTTSTSNSAPAIYAAPASGARADGIDAYASHVESDALYANGSNGAAGLFATSDSGNGAIVTSGGGPAAMYLDQQYAGSPVSFTNYTGMYVVSGAGPGVYAESMQDPAFAGEMSCNVYDSNNTGVGPACAGLYIQQDGSSGYPILVYEPNSTLSGCGNKFYPFYVQSNGDVFECGTTTTSDVYQRSSNPGSDAVTYSAKQTESTVEDFGTAQLVNGVATVPLAADFKGTINASAPYMVFTMPHGDSRGLYLASQSSSGFVIRESQGGRSTMTFDYRIVARPYGDRRLRMPHESQLGLRDPGRSRGASAGANSPAAFRAREATMLGRAGTHRYVAPAIPASFGDALRKLKTASR